MDAFLSNVVYKSLDVIIYQLKVSNEPNKNTLNVELDLWVPII